MEADFWHKRWDENKVAFHEGKTNVLFERYFNKLELELGARIFVPLCGKTEDFSWLLAKGFKVVGVELSEKAIVQLFENLGLEPNIENTSTESGSLKHYSAENIDIFVGDIFDITSEALGKVDVVYDRAALVALPFEMRMRYALHLSEISRFAPQLLISFEYDQNAVDGPPFCVNGEEVQNLYGKNFKLEKLESRQVKGGLRGVIEADEIIWFLDSQCKN